MASTWPLVTLVDVFCYITSKIMMHTGGHDDQELYITSIPYTCLRVCIPGSRNSTDEPRITEHTSNRRRRQAQLGQHPGARDTGCQTKRGSRTESIHEMSVCLGDPFCSDNAVRNIPTYTTAGLEPSPGIIQQAHMKALNPRVIGRREEPIAFIHGVHLREGKETRKG